MYILNIVNPIETFSLKTVTNKFDFLGKKKKQQQKKNSCYSMKRLRKR